MVGADVASDSFDRGDFVPSAPLASPEEKKPIPRRNLSKAFEALCVDTSTTTNSSRLFEETTITSTPKSKSRFYVSPTSVTEPLMEPPHTPPLAGKAAAGIGDNDFTIANEKPYEFNLHRDLSRDLTTALVSRVSLYAVIHDINKEAAAMAANDPLNKEENKEDLSPLVQAVTGSETVKQGPEVKCAMIDEELWLLDAINNRPRSTDDDQQQKECPQTFLQAMGEKEYENPVNALSGSSRTQLWKPSRSWWEAKSGKNPWIEPNSHNKRWRYLWPFIHYHKFLAKCIKKLKRNGVDVKHSVSPVAVFLREEVCAVSDHLAVVSMFGSEEWMECLQHFHGWTAEDAEDELLMHIRKLKLRPLNEPGDVDSPLLRSQIDEHFLKAMAAQREQLREIPTANDAPKKEKGHPLVYPRPGHSTAMAPGEVVPPSPVTVPPSSGLRRPRYPQQQPQYWAPAAAPAAYTDHHAVYAGDNTSVQSGISTESGFPPAPQYSEYTLPSHQHHHHMAPPQYFSPYYATHPIYAGSQHLHMDPHHHEIYHHVVHPHHQHSGWVDPALAAYSSVQQYYAEAAAAALISPSSPKQEPIAVTDKEEKEDHTNDVTPQFKSAIYQSPQHPGYSPFWSHLVDGATQSLVTPSKTPSTPNRFGFSAESNFDEHEQGDEIDRSSVTVQPLLLRTYAYGYGHYGARDGYAPPSPATQFMMPPTQNSTFYYGGYGSVSSVSSHSPGRFHRNHKPQTPVRKMVDIVSASPATAETSTQLPDNVRHVSVAAANP